MLYNLEPLVRERAIDAFNPSDVNELLKYISPLLDDPIRMVRIAAALKISVLGKEYFPEEQFKRLNEVLDEYRLTLEYTADFPTGKYNLGNFYSNKGDFIQAEKFYKNAIQADRMFYPAKSNLAMLNYNNGELNKAEELFLDLIKNHPEYNEGEYYLGLLYAEQKKYTEAADILERAALRETVNPRIYYNLGLIYQYLNPKRGLKWAAVEVPAGVRGRMSLYGPMIEQADATIIIHDADFSFGCMGCARTNELIQFLLRKRGIPVLDLRYPRTEEEGIEFVAAIRKFLQELGGGGE